MTDEAFKKCVEFHGHTCPGLAIGFRGAQILTDRLGVRKSADEELVAVVETDACSSDAIQVMTGCTFGKGNFVFKNYGKHAFSLTDRKQGRTFRVCLRPDVLNALRDHRVLIEKVRSGQANQEETDRYRTLQQQRIESILNAPAESLFKIEEVSPFIPSEAKVVESAPCDSCGELTKIDLLCEVDGRKACIPCAQKRG
ncbi:MAG: formylmethanofuran dehydrogenase [Deltaproteobacteria bacterium]|nr:formylmethanofuran dehydrogenase [Deltaproteobacteria bacterium]